MNAPWFDKASEHLEWARLVDAVLARCRGPSARERGLTHARDRDEAALLLREAAEAVAMLERGERVPLDGLRELDPLLARIERQGALKASGLADILSSLQAARALRGFLGAQRAHAPMLHAACSTDPALDELEDQLRAALGPDGSLSDAASPELKSLRSEVANLRERIIGRLRELIERYTEVLSDQYYTVRDGRYVLPVRRDAHERVQGIVHGTSQSGASVFVEPRAVLAHGNRLKMAESELEREEERVLAALSELVRDYLPSLRAAADALDRMDLRHACALLARDLGGVVPELVPQSEVRLRAARHPLLVLDGVTTVANDIDVAAGEGLVISGPNASGKTVALKTLGLCALMVRHGLPIAAAPGSRVGYFEQVHTDVGDEQSTAKNLSTFSAHITNLAAILAGADSRSLVLLDELATGTDPEQGAALACAIVDALCARGAALAVTTHYEPLKAFALRDPRLRSASVGFDVDRMEPTFTLTMGVPGGSSALLVAKRFGIPDSVLEVAQRILPEQARDFERLVRELGERSQALAAERTALAAARAEVESLRAEERTRLDRLKREGDARVAREAAELVRDIKAARGELDRARSRAKAEAATKHELAEAERDVAKVAARVALGGDLAASAEPAAPLREDRTPLPEATLRPGMRVHVPRLRSDALVVEPPAKGKVRVAVGPLKLWVESADLLAAAAEDTRPSEVRAQPRSASTPPGRTPDNTLNLKGMRVDDALSMMETFIDRLYTTDMRVGYILHGHGTGALREAVRKHLRGGVPHVRDSRPADADEGGDAFTVFYLA